MQQKVVDYEIEAGARLAGRQVKGLGLPPGCLLIRYGGGGNEFVPI
jgi:hypothetical protein